MGILNPGGSITTPWVLNFTNTFVDVANRAATYFGDRPSVTDPGYFNEIKYVHTAATDVYGADGNIDWHDTVDILKLAESVHQDDGAFHSTVVNLFSLFSEGGQLTGLTSNDYLNPQYLNSPQANGEPDNSEQQHHTIGTGFSTNALLNNGLSALYWEWQNSTEYGFFNTNDVAAFGVGQQSRNHFILEGPDGFITYLEESVVQATTEEDRAIREALLTDIQTAYESGEFDPEHPEAFFEEQGIVLPEEINRPKPKPIPKDERDDLPPPPPPVVAPNTSGSPDDRDERARGRKQERPMNSSGSPDDRDENPPPTTSSSGSPTTTPSTRTLTEGRTGGGVRRR